MNKLETLQAEVERLRSLLDMRKEDNTHQCRRCLVDYTPAGANEDCPACGHDGIDWSAQGQAGQGEKP